MFVNNRKTFFRNLGKDHILVEKPPNKGATVHFGVASGRAVESTTIQQSG